MNDLLNRRRFLKSSGCFLSLAALSPSLGRGETLIPAAAKPYSNKGIMWDTVGVTGSVFEKFQAIKEAGFTGVEVTSHMAQAEALKARDATGLIIPSVCGAHHWTKPLSDPDPNVRAQGVEALKQTLRDAKCYGATSVLLVPGRVDEKVPYDDCWERSTVEIRKVIPMAETLGVKIAIENVWNGFIVKPQEAVRYVDQFNSPVIGWQFDVGNALIYSPPQEWIRALGKRIQKVHLKEFSLKLARKEGRRKGFEVQFLEGDNNWPEVMKALQDVGYADWCITEQSSGDNAASLKALAERADKILAMKP